MGDAAGVRRETGEQAKILNLITKDLFKHSTPEEINQNLKELVGHTPLQVIVGSALGFVIPFLMGLIPLYQAYSPFLT
jgi:acid phosphatase family membrane protein YuiD